MGPSTDRYFMYDTESDERVPKDKVELILKWDNLKKQQKIIEDELYLLENSLKSWDKK